MSVGYTVLQFSVVTSYTTQALKVPGVWGAQIWRQSSHEGGKVVSPTHWPPLPPPRKYSWVRPEGLRQWKIAVTPSGIELATLRAIACPNLWYT
jgi:hypothetical protein